MNTLRGRKFLFTNPAVYFDLLYFETYLQKSFNHPCKMKVISIKLYYINGTEHSTVSPFSFQNVGGTMN